MEEDNNPSKPASHHEEIESWWFSLIPVGVAFAFYMVFILYARLENSGLFIAFGAAAGIIGLESYWIVRGWRNQHKSTVVMGIIGIVITLGLLYLFLER